MKLQLADTTLPLTQSTKHRLGVVSHARMAFFLAALTASSWLAPSPSPSHRTGPQIGCAGGSVQVTFGHRHVPSMQPPPTATQSGPGGGHGGGGPSQVELFGQAEIGASQFAGPQVDG